MYKYQLFHFLYFIGCLTWVNEKNINEVQRIPSQQSGQFTPCLLILGKGC
jgi:hypothetical protein